MGIVEGSHPCDTFSNAGHINTERQCNYQFPSRAPRPGPKKQYATGHRKMARNMILSTKEWVAAGATRGEQLNYYLDQGQSSTLKKLKRRGQQEEAYESCLLQWTTASTTEASEGDAAGGGEAPDQDLDIHLDQCDRMEAEEVPREVEVPPQSVHSWSLSSKTG